MRSWLFYFMLLPLLAGGMASPEDQAAISALQREAPELHHFLVLQRLQAKGKADIVLVLGSSSDFTNLPAPGGYWWTTKDRLGLFLQDPDNPGRVYQLTVAPGPTDDCFTRIERFTAQDLVLSCIGEKWASYKNQKFVYDLRTKALVAHFSYQPFSVSRILPGPNGPEFLMSDMEQALLVAVDPATKELHLVPQEQAQPILSRIPMEESSAGDRIFHTPVPPSDPAAVFGPAQDFRLPQQKNRHGSDYRIVVEDRGTVHTVYPLPQSDSDTWREERPDEAQSGLRRDQAEMNEQIGPHQVEGGRLWFGKTFYDSEGLTGVGGFGYFDTETRKYRLYSPPQIHRWSVSAILVEPEFIWLALYRRGEYGNTAGGLLRWDRKAEQAHHFDAGTVITAIAQSDDALYLGAPDRILVLRGDRIQSYFVDRTIAGGYRIGTFSPVLYRKVDYR